MSRGNENGVDRASAQERRGDEKHDGARQYGVKCAEAQRDVCREGGRNGRPENDCACQINRPCHRAREQLRPAARKDTDTSDHNHENGGAAERQLFRRAENVIGANRYDNGHEHHGCREDRQ
ncbi:MAG TPA: hypothetical protein VE010_04805 [Thermoanaerobaculia bacterium]|nr:hypothetical protein [Thermoanaerobaculia bacterium]